MTGDARVTGAFFDSSNASGTNGMVLQTTGVGTQWVATSSFGGFASGARAYQNVSQTLTSAGDRVLFQVESYDRLGEFSNNIFTASAAGYYLVSASVGIVNPADLDKFQMTITTGGSYQSVTEFVVSGANNRPTISVTDVI